VSCLTAVVITMAVNVPELDTWAVFTMTAMSAAEASEATARACCGEGPAERLRGGDVGAAGLRWLWGLVADCQRPPSLESEGNTLPAAW